MKDRMRGMKNTSIQIGGNAFLENHFTVLQSPWVLLSPYGDFPHARGLQRVDMQAATLMVRSFNSVFGKLGRFFTGLPFYIGHPDLPGASRKNVDNKAYGWIMAVEARADGMYGLARWSKAGTEIIEQAHYKFLSPFWTAEQIAVENGRPVFRPMKLISVGLTNHPNIPINRLANNLDREQFRRLDLVGEARSFAVSAGNRAPQPAGLQNEHRMAPQTAVDHPENEMMTAVLRKLQLAETASIEEVEARIAGLQNAANGAAMPNRYSVLERQIALLNSRLLNHIVNEAVVEGRLLPNQRAFCLTELERDFENTSIQLANAGRVMKTTPRAERFNCNEFGNALKQ